MRRVAGVGWLLLVGCNRIFGITDTQPYDAPPKVGHVALTWQLATASPSGAPSATLEYPPFAPGAAPQIRIAPLDGAFGPATYSSDAMPGLIEIPHSYFESPDDVSAPAPWRLEYTLPPGVPGAGVPHEVQWAPADKVGHLVVPMVGRLDRSPVPTGSGYRVTLTNHSFTGTHNTSVLTTGLWTTGITAPPSGMVVDFDFSGKDTNSLSGDKGSLDAAQGDRGFVVDYALDPDNKMVLCNVAIGSAALPQLALTPNVHTAQTATWDAGRVAVISELPDIAGVFARLGAGLRGLNMPISSQDSQLLFGSVPSISFPGLIGSAPPPIRLPIPVMQTLLQCPQGPQSQGPTTSGAIPDTAQPLMLGDFPKVVHVQLVEARLVSALGVTLYSGIETVIAASAGGGFRMSFPAAIPTQIMLDTPANGRVDLVGSVGGPDQLAVGPPTGAFILAFTPEIGIGLRADYHDVYLHRISGAALTTERIYTVTEPQVRIDGSVLAPNTDYVFEIRSYAGHVMAPRGDFAPVDYPYGSAVVFTRTFKTN